MHFMWIFALPNKELFFITTSFFVTFGVLGFIITSRYVKKWLGPPPASNDIISNLLAIIGVLYGVTLGLIVVATWGKYCKTEDLLYKEANLLGTLYKSVSLMPPPYDKQLKEELKEITRYIIYDGWQLQERGIIPKGENTAKFLQTFYTFQPETEKQERLDSYIISKYSAMLDARKIREQSIMRGVPNEFYWVLFLGAFINIAITWLFVTEKMSIHIITTAMTGLLIGSLIFLVLVMDYPFFGEGTSIPPTPYISVYKDIMNG